MASSFSDLLRLELQADGENDDTWGVLANRVFELIEASIAGAESLAVTDSDVTLTTANGTADQARKAVLLCSGTLTGNRAVIVPAKTKLYVVRNATAGAYSLTVKTSAGTGIAVPQGFTQLLMCDGTNVVSVTPPVSDSGLGGYFATLRLPETSAPSGVANVGFLYTKDVAGATELFYIDASGNEVQVSDGGKINGAALKDLSVPTGALADKAVTLAKMADLAEHSIIIGGASNRPAAEGIGASEIVGRGASGGVTGFGLGARLAEVAGAFAVAGLRVHAVNKADVFSTANTSYTDITGLSITLTPKSSGSKFLLYFSGLLANSNSGSGTHVQFVRNSTPVGIGAASGSKVRASATTSTTGSWYGDQVSAIHFDEPATASSITYKMQMRVGSNTGYLGQFGVEADNANWGRVSSAFIVFEIEDGNQ